MSLSRLPASEAPYLEDSFQTTMRQRTIIFPLPMSPHVIVALLLVIYFHFFKESKCHFSAFFFFSLFCFLFIPFSFKGPGVLLCDSDMVPAQLPWSRPCSHTVFSSAGEFRVLATVY